MKELKQLQTDAVALLERLVATPSVSRDEACTADLLAEHLASHGIAAERLHNNIYARATRGSTPSTSPATTSQECAGTASNASLRCWGRSV